jgi:hypothetical protein
LHSRVCCSFGNHYWGRSDSRDRSALSSEHLGLWAWSLLQLEFCACEVETQAGPPSLPPVGRAECRRRGWWGFGLSSFMAGVVGVAVGWRVSLSSAFCYQQLTPTSAMPVTLPCGKQQSLRRYSGPHPGGTEGPAGTSSALPWPGKARCATLLRVVGCAETWVWFPRKDPKPSPGTLGSHLSTASFEQKELLIAHGSGLVSPRMLVPCTGVSVGS